MFASEGIAVAHAPLTWSADDLRGLAVPTLLVVGDTDFVRVEHVAEMLNLIPDARLAVLTATTHVSLCGVRRCSCRR
ncbi:hypothetical protein [Streptomyces sp. NPDC005349]|uniref:alpha/beta fold hydrolase n=1 Tax=unclassified Streptomyces TaxID=2593676 RepID=UPI00324C0A14